MNDAVTQQEKRQAAVTDGMRHFERIEKSFDKLGRVFEAACAEGMIDKCKCHYLQNWCEKLKAETLMLHCEGTHIAQKHNCDVPGGDDDGGVVVQGGPGR